MIFRRKVSVFIAILVTACGVPACDSCGDTGVIQTREIYSQKFELARDAVITGERMNKRMVEQFGAFREGEGAFGKILSQSELWEAYSRADGFFGIRKRGGKSEFCNCAPGRTAAERDASQRQKAREQERQAAEHEQQQKYKEDFQAALKGANEGDVDAARILAACYVVGRGTPKNEAEGLKWVLKMAANNDSFAQFGAYQMYETGCGTPANQKEAMKWLRKAADGGHEKARLRLQEIEPLMALKDAEALEKSGKLSQALDAYQAVLAFDNAEVKKSANEAILKLKADPNALDANKKARERERRSDEARKLVSLARNFMKNGLLDHAREKLNDVITDFGDTPEAAEAKKELTKLK